MSPDERASLEDRLRGKFEIGAHPIVAGDCREIHAGSLVEAEWTFCTKNGEAVRGLLMKRGDLDHPAPAILYIHAHGGRYDIGLDELRGGRPGLDGPLGRTLAEMGFVIFGIEMPGFGTRQMPNESARAKTLLWRGRSLAGQMLGELSAAFEWLGAREDVDAARIGVFGLSMGATLGYWLGAVEPRIAWVAHLCCLADFGALIETGAHDLHGIYLMVPGLVELASNGLIAGLIAPRPQFVGIGDTDPLTPPPAFDPAFAEIAAAYAAAKALGMLTLHREPAAGHVETPAMRATLMAFLANQLAPAASGTRRPSPSKR